MYKIKYFILAILLMLPFILGFNGGGWSDSNPIFDKGGLNCYMLSENVLDEGEIVLQTGVSGFGQVMAGDDEWMSFHFTSAGVVTKVSGTTNTAASASDGNLCVYDAGEGISVKNALGSTKTLKFVIYYSE